MPVNDTPAQVTVFGTSLAARQTMLAFNPYSLPVCVIAINEDDNGDPECSFMDRMWIRKLSSFYYHKVERSDMFIAIWVHPRLRPMADGTRRALSQAFIRDNISTWNSLKYNDSIDPLSEPVDMTLWATLWTTV
jgi:hypothetical protein